MPPTDEAAGIAERCRAWAQYHRDSKLGPCLDSAAALIESQAKEIAALWEFVKARDEKMAANKQFLQHDISEQERMDVAAVERNLRLVLSELWDRKQNACTAAGEAITAEMLLKEPPHA